jgi:hypothetical protein
VAYSIYLTLGLATAAAPDSRAAGEADDFLDRLPDQLRARIDAFARGPIDPAHTAQFERDLQQLLREAGRQVVQYAYNRLEPDAPLDAPKQVRCEHLVYRRLLRKTPRSVGTLLGTVVLRRLGYRDAQQTGEPLLFPLERQLGVVQGVSPALLERLACYQAQAGANQRATLARLKADHGVVMGVKRLRQVTAQLAEAMAQFTPAAQCEQLLEWLRQAQTVRGPRRVVLCLGRDGITLGLRKPYGSLFEVATTATVSVYDRAGRRQGTVYLARAPQRGQAALSAALTELLLAVLRDWTGPPPRLSYVTDAGKSETRYYQRVLRLLRHPRTHRRLRFVRVVDYYHACCRLTAMGEALFGKGSPARVWAKLMRKELRREGGVDHVLRVAARLRHRLGLRGRRLANFQRARNYLKKRRGSLLYAQYERLGIPIGSGVTEAGCKTVFTQRLKLSGMRWTKAGAETILKLRVAWLSGVWEAVWSRLYRAHREVQIPTNSETTHTYKKIVA